MITAKTTYSGGFSDTLRLANLKVYGEPTNILEPVLDATRIEVTNDNTDVNLVDLDSGITIPFPSSLALNGVKKLTASFDFAKRVNDFHIHESIAAKYYTTSLRINSGLTLYKVDKSNGIITILLNNIYCLFYCISKTHFFYRDYSHTQTQISVLNFSNDAISVLSLEGSSLSNLGAFNINPFANRSGSFRLVGGFTGGNKIFRLTSSSLTVDHLDTLIPPEIDRNTMRTHNGEIVVQNDLSLSVWRRHNNPFLIPLKPFNFVYFKNNAKCAQTGGVYFDQIIYIDESGELKSDFTGARHPSFTNALLELSEAVPQQIFTYTEEYPQSNIIYNNIILTGNGFYQLRHNHNSFDNDCTLSKINNVNLYPVTTMDNVEYCIFPPALDKLYLSTPAPALNEYSLSAYRTISAIIT